VLELFEATCDPSETPLVGALIASAPAVNVNVAGVMARAGMTAAPARTARLEARSTNLGSMVTSLFVSEDRTSGLIAHRHHEPRATVTLPRFRVRGMDALRDQK
jgi:hypothetical protein